MGETFVDEISADETLAELGSAEPGKQKNPEKKLQAKPADGRVHFVTGPGGQPNPAPGQNGTEKA